MMSSHGTSLHCARLSGETLLAASPIISTDLTKDKANIRLISNSVLDFPATNDRASLDVLSICRRRIMSSLCILYFSLGDNLVAKVTAQVLRRSQVHLPIFQERRQLPLNPCQPKQTGDMLW